ncbi:ATP-binding protein [uncultured Kordia sp.]|uniref:ATP-binding protein n=1 Tax=uncultured Kordia sp. TaxID=507699 RepID=UPI0026379368|nr:ATP-binding protein [uncultured Kordia sp.]
MSNSSLSKYSAKIKDVYIELKGYEFFHSPFYKDKESKDSANCNNRFIGREKIIERIISILANTKIKSGAYLITGFRGMGKTSVIREAIFNFNEKEVIKENKWHLYISIFLKVIFFTLTIIFFICSVFKFETQAVFYAIIISSIVLIIALTFLSQKSENYKLQRILSLLKRIYFIFFICFVFLVNLIKFYISELDIFHFPILEAYCRTLFNGDIQALYSLGEKFVDIYEPVTSYSSIEWLKLTLSIIVSYLILISIFGLFDLLKYLLRRRKQQKKQLVKYEKFEINLSQEGLNEIDVLRRIAINVREYWKNNEQFLRTEIFRRKIYQPIKFLMFLVNDRVLNRSQVNYNNVLKKLDNLINRMSGQVSSHKELKLSTESTSNSSWLTNFSMPIGSYSDRNAITYPVANSKEIEDYLIEIFKDIDVLRERTHKTISQFAFIIDELDKVEPQSTIVLQEKEFANPTLDFNSLEDNKIRKRQAAVANLLANLKGFLNVVRVKFFFIGGREMYDAYLADIADRDSFYSSIFNDVIYVESFFKDSFRDIPGSGGVTQMTERYLCNIIMNNLGGNENKEKLCPKPNLKKLYQSIKSHSINEFDENRKLINVVDLLMLSYSDKKIAYNELSDQFSNASEEERKKIFKIISTLQNYIIYLTYRSNGTPKKLTTLTEKIIVSIPFENEKFPENFLQDNLVVLQENDKNAKENKNKKDQNTDRLFLKFNFNFQYEIGLTASLYRPYIISNSRHLKSLGDKLLFSSSFIIDHIFKFHSFGFSWRNLELIPEVVLVNREPNLRKFIEDLMRFYSSNYIENTTSGIFDYKFRSIVRRELIYLSKTSDLSSAAFNFTLDESLFTKRHYKKKLHELEKRYEKYIPIADDNQFIHSVSFVQTILGDLHFYDKEYDEAIVYYSESIQSLRFPRAITDRKITRHQFLIWLRNQLKLGLTLEKIRAFDSAFSLYKTLILDTERYLKIVVGLNENNNKHYARNIYNSENIEVSEDHRTLQIISMPFLALLAATEKSRLDGITYASLSRNRSEFKRVIGINNLGQNPENENQKLSVYRKNYLLADYYNNIGSLIYFKNCQFPKFFLNENYFLEVFKLKNNITSDKILKQQQNIYDKTKRKDYDFYPSLTSFNYYWNSLYFLVDSHKNRIEEKIKKKFSSKNASAVTNKEISEKLNNNLLAITAGFLLPECIDMISSKRMFYIANIIVKLGDSILGSLKHANLKMPIKKLDIFKKYNEANKLSSQKYKIRLFLDSVGTSMYTIEMVINIYYLAAILYRRSGDNTYYASLLMKILYLLKDLIVLSSNNRTREKTIRKFNTSLNINVKKSDFRSIEGIAENIFQITSWNNQISNRPQILKYREVLGIYDNKDIGRDILYNNLSNTSDNREVIILVESIKMKLYSLIENIGDNNIKHFALGKTIVSPYGSMNNRYIRMLELKYRAERCYFIMKRVLNLDELFLVDLKDQVSLHMLHANRLKKIKENIKVILNHDTNIIDRERKIQISNVIEFLIKEALFCFGELIKMFKLYDPGYVIGYSYIALTHDRMGDWCNAYENYKNILLNAFNFSNFDDESKESIKKFDKNSTIENIKFDKKKGEVFISKIEYFQKSIQQILDSEVSSYIDSKSHYEIAAQYYYKMIQLHSDGKSYNDKLHELYILEDDYNDIITHHMIAEERFRINTGSIRKKILRIEDKLFDEKSRVYQYKSYLPENIEKDNLDYEKEFKKIYLTTKYLDFFDTPI